jgi:hypothetical protein
MNITIQIISFIINLFHLSSSSYILIYNYIIYHIYKYIIISFIIIIYIFLKYHTDKSDKYDSIIWFLRLLAAYCWSDLQRSAGRLEAQPRCRGPPRRIFFRWGQPASNNPWEMPLEIPWKSMSNHEKSGLSRHDLSLWFFGGCWLSVYVCLCILRFIVRTLELFTTYINTITCKDCTERFVRGWFAPHRAQGSARAAGPPCWRPQSLPVCHVGSWNDHPKDNV